MPWLPPITVVETREFLALAHKLMMDEERAALVDYVASHPEAGDLIPGGGGIRKLRWSLPGRGKRGGARVIYFFHSERIPLFLLSAYAKNQREDISDAERNAFRRLTKALAETYGKAKA